MIPRRPQSAAIPPADLTLTSLGEQYLLEHEARFRMAE